MNKPLKINQANLLDCSRLIIFHFSYTNLSNLYVIRNNLIENEN